MNIALILAGGMDSKFQLVVPKQFVNVNNRPIIVYTLERFQNNKEIDAIVVACLPGWREMVKAYAKQFEITKLQWVIDGGISGQESAFNGVKALVDYCKPDDIIILHDAIRPMVSDDLICDCIRVCREHEIGVASVPSRETIMLTDDGECGQKNISRFSVMRIQTPQAYKMSELMSMREAAEAKGILHEWEMSSVASALGHKVYFSKGSNSNIKISTLEDVEIFRALYSMEQEEEII